MIFESTSGVDDFENKLAKKLSKRDVTFTLTAISQNKVALASMETAMRILETLGIPVHQRIVGGVTRTVASIQQSQDMTAFNNAIHNTFVAFVEQSGQLDIESRAAIDD